MDLDAVIETEADSDVPPNVSPPVELANVTLQAWVPAVKFPAVALEAIVIAPLGAVIVEPVNPSTIALVPPLDAPLPLDIKYQVVLAPW